MKKDVSIHFTIKGQSVGEIAGKLENARKDGLLPFEFSIEEQEVRTVLHHCFLPEKLVKERKFSTEIYDRVLNPMTVHQVCWFDASHLGLLWSRKLMLENIKKTNGVAVFVGEIKEGVEEELRLAQNAGVEIIHIPYT